MDIREIRVIRTVNSEVLKEIQNILVQKCKDRGGDILHEEVFCFENGYEADIRVINAEVPFVDPVLFHHGCEVFALEVNDSFAGEFCFELIDEEDGTRLRYIAVIQ